MGEKHRKALSSLALTYVSPLQDLRFGSKVGVERGSKEKSSESGSTVFQ